MGVDQYTIGLDPGKGGGISVFKGTKLVYSRAFEKMGTDFDIQHLSSIMRKLKKMNGVYAFIEDVHAIYGSSAKNTFEFGWTKGALEGMVAGLKIPYYLTQPKEWQGYSWKGVQKVMVKKPGNKKKTVDTKKTSLKAAKNLFPYYNFVPEHCRKENMGMVDSALIGWYGVKQRP